MTALTPCVSKDGLKNHINLFLYEAQKVLRMEYIWFNFVLPLKNTFIKSDYSRFYSASDPFLPDVSVLWLHLLLLLQSEYIYIYIYIQTQMHVVIMLF